MPFDPKCLDNFGVATDFDGGSFKVASVCDITIKLPKFPLPPVFVLPPIPFPPPLPIPKFSFGLSCDLKNPIDITAGISFGGGRIACFTSNPDDQAA